MQIRPPFMVSYSITTKCNLKYNHCCSDSVDQAAPDEEKGSACRSRH